MSVPLLYSWMVSVRGVIGTVFADGRITDWESEYIFPFYPSISVQFVFFTFFLFLHIRVFLLGLECRGLLLFGLSQGKSF